MFVWLNWFTLWKVEIFMCATHGLFGRPLAHQSKDVTVRDSLLHILCRAQHNHCNVSQTFWELRQQKICWNVDNYSKAHRDAGTGVHDGGTAPLPFERGGNGTQVPLHNSIIGNFRDAVERWNDGVISPCPQGGTGTEVPFHNRITGNLWFIKINLK